MGKIKTKARLILLFIIGFMMISISYRCSLFSISEDDARDTSKRFFNMLMLQNDDDVELEKLYPNFKKIGKRIVFQKTCVINNISKNSDGDFEIYASYKPNRLISYPIYLLVGGSKSNPIILLSKGINYAYYDKVFEYGKKIGALKGNENDVEMSKIIIDRLLSDDLDIKVAQKISTINNNLQITSNLKSDGFGYVSGNVSIINNNNFYFEYPELQIRIDFFDRNNQITFSTNETFYEELRSYGSVSKMVFEQTNNSVNYKVSSVVNSDLVDFRNRIKDLVIQEE